MLHLLKIKDYGIYATGASLKKLLLVFSYRRIAIG